MLTKPSTPQAIAIYASPECCRKPNLFLYKSYYNVAWFVRAYAPLLFRDGRSVFTTDETKEAILRAEDGIDPDLQALWDPQKELRTKWQVPWRLPRVQEDQLKTVGRGFDAQVALAAKVAEGEIDRLLMFQDPDDVRPHLPEAQALIRNCTLADVALNINAGATFWAESEWWRQQTKAPATRQASDYGAWALHPQTSFYPLLNPPEQRVAFIAHDKEKPKMFRLVYHYRKELKELGDKGVGLTGTSGTCKKTVEYLAERLSPWEMPTFRAAGASTDAGHGPKGGDVVIAHEILQKWRLDEEKLEVLRLRSEVADNRAFERNAYKAKSPVRMNPLTHVVVFFIDHERAQPHQADIHVLLTTCLHPSHGVHALLTERSAREWAEALRGGWLSQAGMRT